MMYFCFERYTTTWYPPTPSRQKQREKKRGNERSERARTGHVQC